MITKKEKEPLYSEPELEAFNVYRNLSELPLEETPKYLDECIVGTCTCGSAIFNVFTNNHKDIYKMKTSSK